MKNIIVDVTLDDLPEKIRDMFRESIKKTIKTTFTKEDDGWSIHCEFMGETCLFKQVHDTELEEDEIIEQFYAKDIEPELIDLLLSSHS